MHCPSCQSPDVQLIKVFSGHNPLMWSPVGGEKDIFGHYKNPKPLHAHACQDCGYVMWNITIPKETNPIQVAEALDELAKSEGYDEGEEAPAFVLADELNTP
ncbi:MAG: hypothetical protein AAGA29_04840 [Planctomycetota bacterium]